MVNAPGGRVSQSVLFRSVFTEYPQREMAMSGKPSDVTDNSTNISSLDEASHRDPALDGHYGHDVEKNEERARKMSRLGGPKDVGLSDSDADSAASVGQQLQSEAGDGIKYRTCSWQKV